LLTSTRFAPLLPTLYCPFPSVLHARTGEAEAATLSWVDRFGLATDPAVRRRLADTRTARLAGRVDPEATLPGLMLNTDWQTWLFLFDDAFCDESQTGGRPAVAIELATRLLAVLETGTVPAGSQNPFLPALSDLRSRLIGLATPEQVARFNSSVTGYLFALTWEAAHREQQSPAPLPEYLAMRRHSGAVPTCLALIDVVNGFELPGPVWWLPRIRALSDAATDVACWANDILSYPKEIDRSTQVLSLPAVLAHERGLSMSQALDEAARLHDERVGEYQELEAPLLGTISPLVDRYLADLRNWMAGNLAWSYETGRYRPSAGA
jgi:hypothetical protein